MAHQYEIQEVVGKGSYGVVAAEVDTHTGERVAIKKIDNVLEHVSEATRILREIKLLRLLRHPDVVQIKHIPLPPCPREFKDIYVVFELMECDLQHVVKANDSLTPEHYQFFLYQLLRGLKFMHTGGDSSLNTFWNHLEIPHKLFSGRTMWQLIGTVLQNVVVLFTQNTPQQLISGV